MNIRGPSAWAGPWATRRGCWPSPDRRSERGAHDDDLLERGLKGPDAFLKSSLNLLLLTGDLVTPGGELVLVPSRWKSAPPPGPSAEPRTSCVGRAGAWLRTGGVPSCLAAARRHPLSPAPPGRRRSSSTC